MTRRLTAVALGLLMVTAAGCQKVKSDDGGAGSALDYPSDTTLLVGFVRKGPAPSAARLKSAIEEVVHEKTDREMAELIDACMAPVGGHLDRTTLAVRGPLKDNNVVVFAVGPGLRQALEGCFKTLQEKRGKSFTPRPDGDYTLYELGGDPVVAHWTVNDELVLAARKDQVASAMAAKGGLKGTPLAKVAGEVDRSARVWIAAAGPGLPEDAELEWASGTIQDLTGTVHALFKSPEAASKAGALAQMAIPKGVKIAGKELEIGISVQDLPTLIPDPDKRGPPLSKDSANVLLDAGPLVFGFFLFAGRSEEVEAPPPVPAESAAPAPEAAPASPPPSPPTPP